jgi:hypothetical protein
MMVLFWVVKEDSTFYFELEQSMTLRSPAPTKGQISFLNRLFILINHYLSILIPRHLEINHHRYLHPWF